MNPMIPVPTCPSALVVSGEKTDRAAAAHPSSASKSKHGDANVRGLVAQKKEKKERENQQRQMLRHLLALAPSTCALEHLA